MLRYSVSHAPQIFETLTIVQRNSTPHFALLPESVKKIFNFSDWESNPHKWRSITVVNKNIHKFIVIVKVIK